jgi:hypothetical protein
MKNEGDTFNNNIHFNLGLKEANSIKFTLTRFAYFLE